MALPPELVPWSLIAAKFPFPFSLYPASSIEAQTASGLSV